MSRVFDPKPFQLGYVALSAPDFERTRDHYLDNVGLVQTDVGHEGEAYLSVGYDHHNIVLRKDAEKALLHVGYHLRPHIELEDFAKDLTAYGLKPEIKSDSQPGVGKLVEVEVVEDNIFQFYRDIAAPVPGFKKHAGAPIRLGHYAVMTPHGDKLQAFYRDFLGFWKTDDFEGVANFYTCNRDHHVVNVVTAPESRVHHIAFELKDTSQHPIAVDNLRAAGCPQIWGPARHTAGHNLAGYHKDPNQVTIELYTEMDVFIPELDMQEPRPWHEEFPMRPKSWKFGQVAAWGPQFEGAQF